MSRGLQFSQLQVLPVLRLAAPPGAIVQHLRLPLKFNCHLDTSPHKAGLARIIALREWIVLESAYLLAN